MCAAVYLEPYRFLLLAFCGIMHALEDRCGIKACGNGEEVYLRVNVRKGRDAEQLNRMLAAGEITREEYDKRRYHCPEPDASGQRRRAEPSQGLRDMLADTLNDIETKRKERSDFVCNQIALFL